MDKNTWIIWSEDYSPADFDYEENDWDGLGDYLGRWFEDECYNLGKPLATPGTCIVAFAILGIWNGRRNGGRVCGDELKSIFDVAKNGNYCGLKFYADRYNVRAVLPGHDGTHYVLFRVAKSDEEADRLVDRIAYGGMTEAQFRKATRSLRPQVAKVYGWQ